jgi:hypothetical protein
VLVLTSRSTCPGGKVQGTNSRMSRTRLSVCLPDCLWYVGR